MTNVGGVSLSKQIVGATIVDKPTAAGGDVYEGTLVDLTGISVFVRYADGTTDTIRDPARFYLADPYYVGGQANYDVYLANGQYAESVGQVNFPSVRQVTEIHWHGNLTKRTYFSDDNVDLSGISLEMRYTNPNDHTSLEHRDLVLPRDWPYWTFSERADTAEPFVRIYLPRPSASSGRAEAYIPVDKIYYVVKAEFDPQPNFMDPEKKQILVNEADTKWVNSKYQRISKVWQASPDSALVDAEKTAILDNAKAAWLKRLTDDTDVKLVVTYTEDKTQTFTIPELLTLRDTTRPKYSYSDEGKNPRLKVADVPFEPLTTYNGATSGLPTGYTSKNYNNVDNKKGATVTFAYRGINMEPLTVPIYGVYLSVRAEGNDNEDIEFNVNPKDQWPDGVGRDTLTKLGGRITVWAKYGLYTNKGITTETKVEFNKGRKTTAADSGVAAVNWYNDYGIPYQITGNDDPGTNGRTGITLTVGSGVTFTPPVNADSFAYVSERQQGKFYDIRTSFATDVWPNIIADTAKDKAYKVTIYYDADPLFQGAQKNAKLSVYFKNVAGANNPKGANPAVPLPMDATPTYP